MHLKSVVALVLVTVGLTRSQPEQGGELFASVNNCSPGTVVRAPEITEVDHDDNRITVEFSTEESPENLYYVVLLTADLSIPLDNAASLAREGADNNARTGRVVMVNAPVTREQITVPVLLSTENRNDRFYVAVMLYRCSWEAHTPDRFLARSGWKLHETDGVPQTVSCADPLEELPYTQAYTLTERPGGPGLLYLRIAAPSEQLEITAYEPQNADNPDKAGNHKNELFKLASLNPDNQTEVVPSILEACRLVESEQQFRNLIVARDNGVYHLFRYFDNIPSGPIEIKAVDSRKGVRRTSVAFSSFTAWRGFVDALSAYAGLSVEDDPAASTVDINDVSSEQKTVQAALTFLAMPTDFHSTLEQEREGVLGSYLNRVDDITRNWSSVAGSLEKITIQTLEANKKAIKRPVSVVNNGPYALFGEKDTARVVYRHAFARLDFTTNVHEPYTEGQTSGLGILWRLSSNARLSSYDPEEQEVNPFTTFLDGGAQPNELYRINGEQAELFEKNGIWLKGNTEPAGDDIEIAVEVRPVALVPKPAPAPTREVQAFFFEGGFGAEAATMEARIEAETPDWEALLNVKTAVSGEVALVAETQAGEEEEKIPVKEEKLLSLPEQELTLGLASNGNNPGFEFRVVTGSTNREQIAQRLDGAELVLSAKELLPRNSTLVQALVRKPGDALPSHVYQYNWGNMYIGFTGLDENNSREVTVDSYDSYTGLTADEVLPAPFDQSGTIRMRVTGDIEVFGVKNEFVFSELVERFGTDAQGFLQLDMANSEQRTIFKALIQNMAVRTFGGEGTVELVYIPQWAKTEKEWIKERLVIESAFTEQAKLTVDYNGDFQVDDRDHDYHSAYPHQPFAFWCDQRVKMRGKAYGDWRATLDPHRDDQALKESRNRQIEMQEYALMRVRVPETMYAWFDAFELRISGSDVSAERPLHAGCLVSNGFNPQNHLCYLTNPEYIQEAENLFRNHLVTQDLPMVLEKYEPSKLKYPGYEVETLRANEDKYVLFSPNFSGEAEISLYGLKENPSQSILLSTVKLEITPVSEKIVVYNSRGGRYDDLEPVDDYPWEGRISSPLNPFPQKRTNIRERVFPTPKSPMGSYTYDRGKGPTEKLGTIDYQNVENILFYTHGFADIEEHTIQAAKNYFKMLHWLGFKGQVVLLTWPGDWPVGFNFTDKIWFSIDQWIVFMSSPAALEVLQQIKSGLTSAGNDKAEIRALVHSLGNQLMADVMRLAHLKGVDVPVDRYFFYEAAVWTNAFYPPPDDIKAQIAHQKRSWEFFYWPGFKNFATVTSKKPKSIWNIYNPKDWALTKAMIADDLSQWGECAPLQPIAPPGFPSRPEYYPDETDVRMPYTMGHCLPNKPLWGEPIPDQGSPFSEPMGMAEHAVFPNPGGEDIRIEALDANAHLDGLKNSIAGARKFAAHSYLSNRPLWAIREILKESGIVDE